MFPEAEEPTLHGPARAGLFVGLIVVGAVLLLARLPPTSWNLLWAEDGSVFLNGALNGTPLIVFEPYAGYMHLVPRLAMAFCALFPLAVVPTVVTIVSAVIVALNAAACFLFLETRIRSLTLRFVAWIAVLLIPVAGGEVLNNIANLHWFLMVGAVCALIVPSRGRAFVVVQCIVVVAAVGSDPLMLMFAPLALVRLLLLRSARDRSVVYAFAVASVVQLAVTFVGVIVNESRPLGGTVPLATELADQYTYRVVLSGLIGVTATMRSGDDLGLTVPGLIVASVIALLVVGACWGRRHRYAILATGGASVLFFVVVFWLQWGSFGGSVSLPDIPIGQRYSVLPTMLLLVSMVLAVDALLYDARRTTVTVVSVIVLVAVALPAVADFRWLDRRAGASSWSSELAAAEEACSTGAIDSAQVAAAPSWFDTTTVPCDRVPAR